MEMVSEAARLTSFVTLGTLTTAQRLAGSVLEMVPGVDPGRVAEETLSMVAVTSARSAAVGLAAIAPVANLVATEVAMIPYRYHDYLVGESMLAGLSDGGDMAQAPAQGIDQEVARMIEFYSAHFAAGQFPGDRQLTDKLELWMGRVIPPRTGTHPAQWLAQIGAVQPLATHNRVVLGYCRKAAAEFDQDTKSDTAD